ncbi:unnamed protein product, partial [marine sediment metagenome]
VYWQQIHRVDESLGSMRIHGILPTAGPYQELFRLRGKLMGQVGFKFPREITMLLHLVGLSPGEIKLWHDVESGFMSEARAYPGAPPVYKAVSDETAMAILKHEMTKELEVELMTPDEYLGE